MIDRLPDGPSLGELLAAGSLDAELVTSPRILLERGIPMVVAEPAARDGAAPRPRRAPRPPPARHAADAVGDAVGVPREPRHGLEVALEGCRRHRHGSPLPG